MPSPFRVKADSTAQIEVQFTREAVVVPLPERSVISFGIKAKDTSDTDPVVHCNAFSATAGSLYAASASTTATRPTTGSRRSSLRARLAGPSTAGSLSAARHSRCSLKRRLFPRRSLRPRFHTTRSWMGTSFTSSVATARSERPRAAVASQPSPPIPATLELRTLQPGQSTEHSSVMGAG